MKNWNTVVGAVGALGAAVGLWAGLVFAPEDAKMGALARILYVHVPVAWVAMLLLTVTFVSSILWLTRREWRWDFLQEATMEVGVVMGILLTVQGSIWAKPTWNTWWAWDPRLTSVAVMVLTFVGILALRAFVDEPVKRATWSATASIIGWVNVPFVYLCVKWMRSLHQTQTPWGSMDPRMLQVLLFNTVVVSILCTWMVAVRYGIAARERAKEMAE